MGKKLGGIDKLVEILRDKEIPRGFCINLAKAIQKELQQRMKESFRKQYALITIKEVLEGFKKYED